MDSNQAAAVMVAGTLAFSALCIYLGYKLFLAGATGAFKIFARHRDSGVGLESVAPGGLFILLGVAVAVWAVYAFSAYGR